MSEFANGGILDPNSFHLLISARAEDVQVFDDGDGWLSIAVENFRGGIEVVHEEERIWWAT